MSESLGKATLELDVNLADFERNMRTAKGKADDVQHSLDSLAAISKISEDALKRVRMAPGQGTESKVTAESILHGVKGIGQEARQAARDLDDVKLDSANAAETTAAGDVIDRKLKEINRNANETTRALEKTRLAGVGVGPFGSGFGRMGVLGAAIGGGALLAPAAGPGALGLLAAIPVLASTGVGALGTLALAFQGVGKAIGGDKKAYDSLEQSQQQFVLTVRSLDGALDKLKETAAAATFPGLTAALHSALSPGTMGAVTRAVAEFGRAIGEAGAQWGKYFGSAEFRSIFGPLMAAGARNLSLMSDAALHLTDAVGVLARAAIPLTSWMVKGADAASRWADSFVHAKDATGGLGRAMDEAKTSLQLVGRLFAALGKAVYELGAALYPVSKVAVKDLADGLQALAQLIHDNRKGIQDFVRGALDALVATVKVAAPLVVGLAKGLGDVVGAMGGWKVAFEIVIGGVLISKMVALAGSIQALGTRAGVAAAEVGGLRGALSSLATMGPIAVAIVMSYSQKSDQVTGSRGFQAAASSADEVVGNKFRYGKQWYTWNGKQAVKTSPPVAGNSNSPDNRRGSGGVASKSGGGFLPQGASYTEGRSDQGRDFQTDAGGAIIAPGHGWCVRVGNDPKGFGPDYPIIHMTSGRYAGKTLYIGHCHSALRAGDTFEPGQVIAYTGTSGVGNATVGGWAEIGFAPGGSPGPMGQATPFGKGAGPAAPGSTTSTTAPPFGTPPPFTKNLPPKPVWKGATAATIIAAHGAVAATLKGLPTALDPVEKNAVAHIKALNALLHIHMSPADLAKDRVELAKWGTVLHTEITKQAKKAAEAAALAKKLFDRALSLDVSHILRDFERAFAQVKTSFDTETGRHLKDMQTAFAIRTKTFDTETGRQLKDMATAFSRQLSVFDAATKTGLAGLASPTQTPEEKALADFIAGRQATLDAAAADQRQADLAAAISGGDPAAIAAAQDAINQAALDVQQTGLQAAADASRTAADKAAADAQQAYQDQRDTLRQALQDQETDLEQAYQDKRDLQKQAMQDVETDLEQAYQDLRDVQWQGLQDIHDDQRTALQNNLDDWTAWLEAKKKPWADFIAWLKANGVDTSGLINPNTGAQTPTASPYGPADPWLVPYLPVITTMSAPASTATVAATLLAGTSVPGLGGLFDSDVGHGIPHLDTGGTVRRTGLAVVDRGETFSGVGPNRAGGPQINLTVNGFVGNEAELTIQIAKLLQRGNLRGLTYGLK